MAIIYNNNDVLTMDNTHTHSEYDKLLLKNGVYSGLYLTSDMLTLDEIQDKQINVEWDDNSIIVSDFDGNLTSGCFELNDSSTYVIKRKEKSDNLWTTVGYINPHDIYIHGNYINCTFTDNTNRLNTTYDYLVTTIMNGQESNPTIIKNVKSDLNGITIGDKNITYYTILEPSVSDEKQNGTTTTIETLDSKYPFSFTNSINNYITANVKGLFVYQKDNCEWDWNNAPKYRKQFREWLKNGQAKILRHWDGRMWICVVGEVSDDDSEHHDKNITSFDVTEIADSGDFNTLVNMNLVNGLDSEV